MKELSLARILARNLPTLCGKSVHSFIIRTLEKCYFKFLQLSFRRIVTVLLSYILAMNLSALRYFAEVGALH